MVICTVNYVHTLNDSSEIRPRSIAVTVVGLAVFILSSRATQTN